LKCILVKLDSQIKSNWNTSSHSFTLLQVAKISMKFHTKKKLLGQIRFRLTSIEMMLVVLVYTKANWNTLQDSLPHPSCKDYEKIVIGKKFFLFLEGFAMHYWQNFTTFQKLLLCFDSTRNTCYFEYNWISEYKVMPTKCLGLFRVWLMTRWCLCLCQYKCLFISIIEFTYKSLCVQIHTL
jgi:hypothetical protein